MPFDLPNDPEDELPDWLKQPPDDSDLPQDEVAPKDEGGEDIPDWLSDADQAPEEEEPEEETEDIPADESDFEADLSEDNADWLEVIRQRAGEEWQPLEPVTYKDGQPEVPDWLKRIRERQAEEMDSQPPDMDAEDLGDTEEQLSFLERIKSFNQQVEGFSRQAEETEEEEAEWLGLDQLPQEFLGEDHDDSEEKLDEVMASIQEGSKEPGAESQPFDMDEFTRQAEEGFVFDTEEPVEGVEESPALELNSFIESVGGESPAVEEESPAPELDSFIESVEGEPPAIEEKEGNGPVEGLPDEIAEASASEEPGWLDNFLEEQEVTEETPEWLEDVRSEIDNLPHASAFVGEGEEFEHEDTEKAGLEDTSEIPAHPSWLSQVERETASLPPLDDVLGGTAGADDSELDSFEPIDYDLDEEDGLDEISELRESFSEEDEINLAPADLPEWLQALRPSKERDQEPDVEVTSEPGEKTTTEPDLVNGPLADLGEALPVSPPIISSPKHAATPVTGLQLTETQRKHMAMLEEVLTEEGAGAEIGEQGLRFSARLQRWALAALVMLAVIIPLLLGRGSATIPAMAPAALDMQQQITSLASGDLVLVAVEYQLAFSGEMQAVAAPVLDQMLVQGVQLVFISSQPTGPALAEQLVRGNLGQHAHISQGGYLNLGYISGGNSALVNLAADPQGSLPLPLAGGGSRWQQAPLNTVNTAADFAAVLVISDDPDNARSWIEQVQPYMAGKPMLMALSAQAGPLVIPYTQGQPQQVSGMVAGLSEAASFANNLSAGSARGYLGAYSWGVSITALLVVLIGIYTLGQMWLKKRG